MMKPRNLRILLIALAILSIVALFLTERVSQSLEYQNFADEISVLSIPNFMNVATNIPFIIVSIIGVIYLLRKSNKLSSFEKMISWIIILSIGLVGVGSSYFHYNPNIQSLVFDRLPMSLIFSSLFSLIIFDYIDFKTGKYVFYIFFLTGITSILYWWYSEQIGAGDLRPYIFVQFFPMIFIPILLLLSHRRTNIHNLILIFTMYVVAKICEHFDRELFNFICISGHSLKHIFAGISTFYILKFIQFRSALIK